MKDKVSSAYFLPIRDAASALLSVTGGKLVPDLRRLHRAHPDLTELVALLVDGHHYLAGWNTHASTHALTQEATHEATHALTQEPSVYHIYIYIYM